MSSGDAWVNLITAASAAGVAAIAAELVTRGARDAVHRIRRVDGDVFESLTLLVKPDFAKGDGEVKASEVDAEAFLRQYVAVEEAKARAEVECD
ncbi:hypothetical protein ACWD7F_00560 [Streptomyces sp. NPDC005122]